MMLITAITETKPEGNSIFGSASNSTNNNQGGSQTAQGDAISNNYNKGSVPHITKNGGKISYLLIILLVLKLYLYITIRTL